MIDSQEIYRIIEYVMKATKWSEDNDDINYDVVVGDIHFLLSLVDQGLFPESIEGYGLFDGYIGKKSKD
jgi:hypothetical protein